MTRVLLDSSSNMTHQVEVTARAVAGLTQRPDELSPTAQVLQKYYDYMKVLTHPGPVALKYFSRRQLEWKIVEVYNQIHFYTQCTCTFHTKYGQWNTRC